MKSQQGKVIGIIGSRRRNSLEDKKQTYLALKKIYKKGDIICSGLCSRGGDEFARQFVENNNLPFIWHPADWKKYGKAAGFIRNDFIARDSDVLIAVVASDRTGGTEDTIRKFLKKIGKTENQAQIDGDLYLI